MVTKSGKHHWQFGFTTYRPDGTVIWNTEKTIVITADIKKYLEESKKRYERGGARFEYRNLIDLDA